jgi:hypothetical protein
MNRLFTAPDKQFFPFFKIIKQYASDGRNFVKKAVNWALRQTGKRNIRLNKKGHGRCERNPENRFVGRALDCRQRTS